MLCVLFNLMSIINLSFSIATDCTRYNLYAYFIYGVRVKLMIAHSTFAPHSAVARTAISHVSIMQL